MLSALAACGIFRGPGIACPSHRGRSPGRGWDRKTMAIREFRGDFHPSEQRELSVGFGSEQAGGSFRRSETRLSGGLTPFYHPGTKPPAGLTGRHRKTALRTQPNQSNKRRTSATWLLRCRAMRTPDTKSVGPCKKIPETRIFTPFYASVGRLLPRRFLVRAVSHCR
jgi:hypothetical protein